MRISALLTVLALVVAAVTCPAQTVDFSPVQLDGDQPAPGRLININTFYAAGAGAVYTLALDIAKATTPIKIPNVGEVGLALTPSTLLLKTGVLNTSGRDSFALGVPNVPQLVGLSVYFQSLVATKNSSGGAFLSNLYQAQVAAAATYTAIADKAAVARAFHTATTLQDGRVLVVGGGTGSLTTPVATFTTELYHPWTKQFDLTRTAQGVPTTLKSYRIQHTAALLNDGRVLLAGGVDPQGTVLNTAEVFDPMTGQFTLVGNMNTARATHTATTLPNGLVLIAGGTTASFTLPGLFGGATNKTEIFDPKTNKFTAGPNMLGKHMIHAALPLRVGTKDYVLIMGGINGLFFGLFPTYSSKAEVYDVSAKAFSGKIGTTTIASMKVARCAFGAAVQTNGKVLLAGGAAGTVPGPVAAAEEFNPATGAFTSVTNIPGSRAAPIAVALPNGGVLVQGGVGGTVAAPIVVATGYLYAGGKWTQAKPMKTARALPGAVLLSSGAVVFIGGASLVVAPLNTAESYTP